MAILLLIYIHQTVFFQDFTLFTEGFHLSLQYALQTEDTKGLNDLSYVVTTRSMNRAFLTSILTQNLAGKCCGSQKSG